MAEYNFNKVKVSKQLRRLDPLLHSLGFMSQDPPSHPGYRASLCMRMCNATRNRISMEELHGNGVDASDLYAKEDGPASRSGLGVFAMPLRWLLSKIAGRDLLALEAGARGGSSQDAVLLYDVCVCQLVLYHVKAVVICRLLGAAVGITSIAWHERLLLCSVGVIFSPVIATFILLSGILAGNHCSALRPQTIVPQLSIWPARCRTGQHQGR